MTVSIEIKGNLAKLLATEDLIIEHKPVETASFDVDRRVLVLPVWDRASETVYDMLVAHEVGHALFTPNREWWKENKLKTNTMQTAEESKITQEVLNQFVIDNRGSDSEPNYFYPFNDNPFSTVVIYKQPGTEFEEFIVCTKQRGASGLAIIDENHPLQSSSNLPRVNSFSKCFGPSGVTEIKGKLIALCVNVDNSIFAFSAASVKRCRAWLSCVKSIPS